MKDQYTCGNCYTAFDRPSDMRCPTCRIREIVPIPRNKEGEK